MKIVRGGGSGADRERLNAARFEMNHIVLILNYPGDQHEAFVSTTIRFWS